VLFQSEVNTQKPSLEHLFSSYHYYNRGNYMFILYSNQGINCRQNILQADPLQCFWTRETTIPSLARQVWSAAETEFGKIASVFSSTKGSACYRPEVTLGLTKSFHFWKEKDYLHFWNHDTFPQ